MTLTKEQRREYQRVYRQKRKPVNPSVNLEAEACKPVNPNCKPDVNPTDVVEEAFNAGYDAGYQQGFADARHGRDKPMVEGELPFSKSRQAQCKM